MGIIYPGIRGLPDIGIDAGGVTSGGRELVGSPPLARYEVSALSGARLLGSVALARLVPHMETGTEGCAVFTVQ